MDVIPRPQGPDPSPPPTDLPPPAPPYISLPRRLTPSLPLTQPQDDPHDQSDTRGWLEGRREAVNSPYRTRRSAPSHKHVGHFLHQASQSPPALLTKLTPKTR